MKNSILTIIIQIEAGFNSRLLTALFEDPNDMVDLVDTSLMAIIEPTKKYIQLCKTVAVMLLSFSKFL